MLNDEQRAEKLSHQLTVCSELRIDRADQMNAITEPDAFDHFVLSVSRWFHAATIWKDLVKSLETIPDLG